MLLERIPDLHFSMEICQRLVSELENQTNQESNKQCRKRASVPFCRSSVISINNENSLRRNGGECLGRYGRIRKRLNRDPLEWNVHCSNECGSKRLNEAAIDSIRKCSNRTSTFRRVIQLEKSSKLNSSRFECITVVTKLWRSLCPFRFRRS